MTTPTNTTGSSERLRRELREQDRVWLAGYQAGVSDRFWPGIRRLAVVAAILAVVPVLWHVAFGRDTRGLFYDLMRAPAAMALVALSALAVGLLPLWLMLGVVMFWRAHIRHRRQLYRPPIDEPPFAKSDPERGLPTLPITSKLKHRD